MLARIIIVLARVYNILLTTSYETFYLLSILFTEAVRLLVLASLLWCVIGEITHPQTSWRNISRDTLNSQGHRSWVEKIGLWVCGGLAPRSGDWALTLKFCSRPLINFAPLINIHETSRSFTKIYTEQTKLYWRREIHNNSTIYVVTKSTPHLFPLRDL